MSEVKIVLKILKWVGIVILAIVLLLVILLFILSKKPFVPSNYMKTVEIGGELEAKYLAMGQYEVKHMEADAPEDWGKFITYYPAEMEIGSKTYPVVVMVNGTGVYASKYPALFKHLASWGFIVIGNEDPSTCSGDSADATLAYLLEQNDDPNSVFYQKVDTAHIGITGHSQGGVGVFNAVTTQPHGNSYTCAVSLSPTEMELADAIGLHYEPDKMTVPTLLLAADANDVITPEGMQEVYDVMTVPKAMALRTGMDHGKMLYSADGYVTAWFLWYLQGNDEAAKVFSGDSAELLENPLYSNQQIDIGK